MRGLSFSLLGCALLVSTACSSGSGGAPPAPGGSGGSTAGSGGSGPSGAGGFGVGGAPGTGGSSGSGGASGSGGSAGSGGESGSGGSTPTDAAPPPPAGDGGPAAVPPPTGMPPAPGMMQIFDGKTLMGWNGNMGIWSVDPAEMAIHGKTGNGGQLIKSTGTYDTFRLILQERAVATMNHMGICIWGGAGGFGYSGCLDVIPPSGHFWDYGGGGDVPNTGVGSANNPIKFMWHQVEIFADATTGEVLVAVNGKQVTNYKKAGRGKKGPIGLQAHAGASDQMYRDIWIDPAPKDHGLVTVTK
jgi:hypothetical protein